MEQEVAVKHAFEAGFHHVMTGKLGLSIKQ